MKNIELIKLSTRVDAEYPQEDRYPSGTTVAIGYMFKHSEIKVGEPFYVMGDKLHAIFRTSIVTRILEETKDNIKFETLNSIYNILIK